MMSIYRYDERRYEMNEPIVIEPEVEPDIQVSPRRKANDSPFTPPIKRPKTKPKA
jgi:hypothetical protein